MPEWVIELRRWNRTSKRRSGRQLRGQIAVITGAARGIGRRIADDIASAAKFLVSDEAKHITGHTLDVNGGLLMD
jgi:NAD(P)-dependent dehydrogenase (short-subunit alcohol dehydrogenase family)